MFYNNISCDRAYPYQLGFQDGATSTFEGILWLHDFIFAILLVIGCVVFWLMGVILTKFGKHDGNSVVHKYMNHGTFIEVVWTITPAIILSVIAIPSFKLLYLLNEIVDPQLTIKVTGHQWYWSYEYSDFLNLNSEPIQFDSFMVPTNDLEFGQLRLLEVDAPVYVPMNTEVRLILTSDDVIHNFAVPSLGLKTDVMPGRLNESGIVVERPLVAMGQCSELCGTGHSAMPISIIAVTSEEFLDWVVSQTGVDFNFDEVLDSNINSVVSYVSSDEEVKV